MLTRSLTAICISAALVASVNAAHAGVIKNVAKIAKINVRAQKEILIGHHPVKLAGRTPLEQEVALAKINAVCLVKAGTKKPC